MATLTKKQKGVYDFIKNYINKKGFSPTFEEIKKHFKLSALSGVHQYIETLKEKGFLTKSDYSARGIELSNQNEQMVQIPLLGTIAAGQPLTLFDTVSENIAVPKNKLPNSSNDNIYALKVAGNSMIEENINDGDTILVRHQNTAENGQKIVALVDGGATLKKFYKERGQIHLQPANKNLEPIIVRRGQDFHIQGIMLDVVETSKIKQLSQPFVLPAKKNIGPQDVIFKKADPYFEDTIFVLYHGDCISILSQLPANSIDMIFADPPYNLSNNGFSLHAGKRVSVNKGAWDKSRGFKDDYNFHYRWLDACQRALKPEGSLWVSGTYHSIYQCGYALQALGYHILNDIAWFKPNGSPNLSCRYFTASHETLIWARKDKKAKHFFNYDLMKNGKWLEDFIKKPNLQMRSVWAIYPPKKSEKKFGKHPTQKPVELLKRIVLASTKLNAVILDPFTGSSTTGIASATIGKRKFIGIDTEKEFLNMSIKRYKEIQTLSTKR